MLSRLSIAWTRCHSTLSRTPSSSFRPKAPKPAKPLGLKPVSSATYLTKGHCQSHFDYLACFQQLSLEKWAFFRNKRIERTTARLLMLIRQDMSCPRSQRVVTRQGAGSRNIPTIQAGILFRISSLPGKLRIGPKVNVVGYRTQTPESVAVPARRPLRAEISALDCAGVPARAKRPPMARPRPICQAGAKAHRVVSDDGAGTTEGPFPPPPCAALPLRGGCKGVLYNRDSGPCLNPWR